MKIYDWLAGCGPRNLVLGQTSLWTPLLALPFGLPHGCVREGCSCLSKLTQTDDVNSQPTADAFTSKFCSEGLECLAISLPLLSGILEPHNSSLQKYHLHKISLVHHVFHTVQMTSSPRAANVSYSTFLYWQHNRPHTCWIRRHRYLNRAVKLTSIGVSPQTSVKKNLKIRILLLLLKKMDRQQFLLFTYNFQTQRAIISFITLCPIQDRGDAAKLLIRINACQWIRHSECCSSESHLIALDDTIWYYFPSRFTYFVTVGIYLCSTQLHSSIPMKKFQWSWKYCSSILMVQDIFALFFHLCLQHCTIISAVFIISSDSKRWNY